MGPRGNSLQAAWSLGRDILNFAAVALADSPPQLTVLIVSAALGFLLDLLPRPVLSAPLRLE